MTAFILKKFWLSLIIFALLLSTFAFVQSSMMLSHASAESDLTITATSFLQDVVRMNLSKYPALSTTLLENGQGQSPHAEISVKFTFGQTNQVPNATLLFSDDKLWSFKFDSPIKLQEPASKTLNDCMAIASGAMNNYANLCNVSYARDASLMISAAVQGQNLTVENDEALLSISYNSCVLNSTCFEWYEKIGNVSTSQYQSVYIQVSNAGQLTEFTDYLAAFHVATTEIIVSEDNAVSLSMPRATAYAESNGLGIVSTEATLEWWRDSTLARGNDEFALYPMWVFTAEYNNTQQDVYGYEVLVWADNGQVFWNGTEAMYLGPAGTTAPSASGTNQLQPLVLLSFIPAVMLIACLGTYLTRRKKRRSSR